MNRIALGIVTGGAAAAAFFGSATAHATGESWTPDYNLNDATLVQAPGSTSLTWEVPATFTGTGTADQTLTGTDYVTPSAGGFNNVFVTDSGATYAQDQLFQGYTNLYYDSGATGSTAVDMLKTPFGTFDMSPFASYFAPTDPSTLLTATDALKDAGLYGALDLGTPSGDTVPTSWTPVYGDATEVANAGGSPVWEVPATFTPDTGTALDGTVYLAPSPGGYDTEFVTQGGAIYAQDQLFQGYTNLYYDDGVASTPVVDMLKTPFGTFDISSFASYFTPTDYSDAVAASPLTDLQGAGLYDALDLGLPAAAAADAVDPLAWLGL